MDKLISNLMAMSPKELRSADPAEPGKAGGQRDSEFEKRMALVGAAVANPQVQRSVPVAKLAQGSEKKESLGVVSQDPGTLNSFKAAAGMSAGAAIAGLKPWSRDWVFEDRTGATAQVQPLFGASAKPTLAAQAAGPGHQAQGIALNPKAAAAALANLLKQEGLRGSQVEPKGGAISGKTGQATRGEAALALARLESVPSPEVNPGISQAHPGLQGVSTAGLQGIQSIQTSASWPSVAGKDHASVAHRFGLGTGQNALSGGEFLHALSAVRGGNPQNFAQSGGFGGENGGGSLLTRDLKLVEGGAKDKKEGLADPSRFAAVLNSMPMHTAPQASVAAPMEMTGHVVPGTMARDRLSTDALVNVSSGIRNLTSQGGGEIRVRLKPDNLGELHLRVRTDGNQVGLQIQASDEKAKKILEESLSHLKDSLSAQHLSLGRVELSVALAGSSGTDARQDQGQQNQNGAHSAFHFEGQGSGFGQNASQSWNGNGGRHGQWGEDFAQARTVERNPSVASLAGRARGARSVAAGSGRLDVQA